jgi:hypothetical protein
MSGKTLLMIEVQQKAREKKGKKKKEQKPSRRCLENNTRIVSSASYE